MSVSSLVQVGTELWLDPKHIVGVRHMDSWKSYTSDEVHPAYTQIIHETPDLMGPTVCYLSSDWPAPRVRAALGMTSVADAESALGDGAPS